MAGTGGEIPITNIREPWSFYVGFENKKPIKPKEIKRGDVTLCSWTDTWVWYYGLFTSVGRKRANGYWMGEYCGYDTIGDQNQRFSLNLRNPKLRLELIDPSVVPGIIRFYDEGGLLKKEYKKAQMPVPHENKIIAALKKINPFQN